MYQDAVKTTFTIATVTVKILISILVAIPLFSLWIFAQIRVIWLSQNVNLKDLKLVTGFEAYMAQYQNCVINCPVGITNMVNIDKVRQRLWTKVIDAKNQNNELRFWKFSHVIEKHDGLSYWRKVACDPQQHIFEYEGSHPSTHKELFKIVSKYHSEALPLGLPGWQFMFVPTTGELKSSGVGCCMIVRLHHSICDGSTLCKLFARHIMDQEMDHNGSKNGSRNNNERNLISKENRSGVLIADVIKKMVNGLSQVPAILLREMFVNNDNLIHGPDLKGCTHCYGITYDISTVQSIHRATGATTNDIFLSCVSGALRNYFLSKHFPLPKELQAAVAINFQPQDAKTDLKNAFLVGNLQLPTGVSKPLERLYVTHTLMDKLKRSTHLFVVHILMFYIIPYLPSFINNALFDTTNNTSVSTSSFTLHEMNTTLFGERILNVFPVDVLLGKTGIGITCATFPKEGKLYVTFCADLAVVENDSDFNTLISNFESEMNTLNEYSHQKDKPVLSDI